MVYIGYEEDDGVPPARTQAGLEESRRAAPVQRGRTASRSGFAAHWRSRGGGPQAAALPFNRTVDCRGRRSRTGRLRRPVIVLDTGGLYAALDANEALHGRTVAALVASTPPRVISPFVFAELDYL